MKSVTEVDLEVEPELMSLAAGQFALELPMEPAVDPDSASAKFDKESGRLEITLQLAG